APAMITRNPRAAAVWAYSSIATGVRWADITRCSCGMSNSASAVTAACMIGQSESLPMITPTWGSVISVSPFPQDGHGPGRLRPNRREVVTERGQMTDLAPGAGLLAVQMHLHPRFGREHMVQPLVEGLSTLGGGCQQVGHHHR